MYVCNKKKIMNRSQLEINLKFQFHDQHNDLTRPFQLSSLSSASSCGLCGVEEQWEIEPLLKRVKKKLKGKL